MAKGGKKPSRGGGLRRGPPPGEESPQVESRKPPTRRPPPGEADESRRGGGSSGSGGMSRGGQSITTTARSIKEEPPDESENKPPTRSSGRGEQSISARNRDDPPDEAPDHQMSNDYNNSHGGRTGDRASSYARERHNGLQPPPSYTPSSRYQDDRHVQKSTNNSRGHQYRDNDTRYYDDGRSVKSTSSGGRVNTRKYHDDQRSVKSSSSGRINTRRYNDNNYAEKSTNYPRGRNAYMENDSDNVNGDYDYPLLDMEQDQYEEYQDQHYNQQYYAQQPSQQSQLPHFSTHRQFNLTPIYDVEMASMSSGKKKNGGSRSQRGSKKGKYEKLSQGGRSKGLDDIFAYLNSDDSEDENSSVSDSNSAEEEEEDEPRRHEEFYNYDDDDDESDYESDEYSEYDDDEERPLRSSKSRRTNNNGLRGTKHTVISILNNSDVCLNRALLLAFAIICFVFVRDRTPWWKEHEQRVAARKGHHHHHIIAGTDDDDEPALDPMAVYNTNDDDSTHTRDHDPLGKYDKYTKDKDAHPSKNDDKDDDASSSAGERISNRPGVKSLHHGLDLDGSYSDRPKAEHSMSSSLPGNEFDVEQIDAEKTAILESEEMESPREEGSGEVVAFGADDGGMDGDNDEMRVEQEILPPPLSSTDEMLEPSGSTIGGEQVASENQQDSLETMPLPSTMENTPGGDVGGSIAAIDSQPHDDMDTLIEWGEPEDESSAEEMPFDEEVADAGDVANPDGQNLSTPKEPVLNEPIFNQAVSMSGEEIKSVYEDSYYKWNHPLEEKDVPVFWRIPRSASSSVESVLSFCYRMTLASDRGAGHEQDETLDLVTVASGAQYVNVDMSRPAGIQRAKGLNLGSSVIPDIISTAFLFETAEVFNGIPETGKCFTLLRHPVDRAISLYHHYQIDESENPNTVQFRGMSVDDYAEKVEENNWMVRFLANKRSGSLTWKDLEAAKDVFGRKCLVGLVDKADESMRRYEHFFGWDKKMSFSEAKERCLQQYLTNGDKRNEHPTYEGTAAWEALRKKNEYDVLLYEYATNLYDLQSKIFEER